jgi:quinol monooxygenase YgiN
VSLERRHVLVGGALAAMAGALPAAEAAARYGLIGRIKAQPGKRAELAAALAEGTGQMPGCLSYVVAEDASDPDTLWVTEVWDSEASHKASLKLPQVRAAIAKGRPLIAGFDTIATTRPIAGI